jgi:hypothetical protein
MKKLFIGTILLFGVVTGVMAQKYNVPELITSKEDLQDIILNSEYSCYTVSEGFPRYWEDPEVYWSLRNPLILMGDSYCYKQVMPDQTSFRLLFFTRRNKDDELFLDFIFYQNDKEGFYHPEDCLYLIEKISDKKDLYEKILAGFSPKGRKSWLQYQRDLNRLWGNLYGNY